MEKTADLLCAACGEPFVESQLSCSKCGGGLVVSPVVEELAPCGRCSSPDQPTQGSCSACGAALPYDYVQQSPTDSIEAPVKTNWQHRRRVNRERYVAIDWKPAGRFALKAVWEIGKFFLTVCLMLIISIFINER